MVSIYNLKHAMTIFAYCKRVYEGRCSSVVKSVAFGVKLCFPLLFDLHFCLCKAYKYALCYLHVQKPIGSLVQALWFKFKRTSLLSWGLPVNLE